MDERQAAINKRKREEAGELSDSPMVDPEKPKANQDIQKPKAKKRKTTNSEHQPSDNESTTKPQETEEQRVQRKKEQKAEKKQRKKEKKAKLKEKLERQKARKKEAKQQKQPQKEAESTAKSTKKAKSRIESAIEGKKPKSSEGESESDDEDVAEVINIDRGTAFAEGAPMKDDDVSSNSSHEETEEVFSPLHDSGVSSSSSVQPPISDENLPQVTSSTSAQPTAAEEKEPSQKVTQAPKSSAALEEDPKQRLQAAISAFRADRKAHSGPKSRSELLEQRRRQEERRRAEKKEQKRREKEEEARKQEEEIAKRFSPGGSGSLMGSPRSPIIDTDNTNYSFGRVAFADGSSLDPTNPSAAELHKKKGPSDPATALKAAQAKQQRLSGYDAEKRENIHEKDMWMNARKRATGEKVKDDTSLLKKALKRTEGQKKKSEKEWTERKEGVQKSMHMKQKKRTENLEKRKDEKGQKGKKNKVKRP